jgi:hypothetical protein
MADPDGVLSERARRAYEMGRLGAALRGSFLLLPAVGVALVSCSSPGPTLVSGAALVLLVAFCLWRGQGYRRGVAPGLVAGFVPLLLPILVHATGHVCVSGGCLLFPTACGVGGVLGGVALGIMAPRPRDGRAIPFVTACLIAGLAGSVGCLLYGFVGLGVMIAGLLAGATPILAARRA